MINEMIKEYEYVVYSVSGKSKVGFILANQLFNEFGNYDMGDELWKTSTGWEMNISIDSKLSERQENWLLNQFNGRRGIKVIVSTFDMEDNLIELKVK